MRIRTIVAAALVVGSIGTATAAPQTTRPEKGFNFGIGYERASLPGADMDALATFIGYRFNKYFGIEIGSDVGKVSGVRLTSAYASAIGRLPITPRLSLYASVGGAYGQADAAFRIGSTTFTASQSGSGLRAGVGAEFWFNRYLGLRLGYTHQDALAKADGIALQLTTKF